MKRLAVISLLLFGLALSSSVAAKEKPKPVDLKDVKNVYIGWVDINPADWRKQGYNTKEEWLDVIANANGHFQDACKALAALKGRTVIGAKETGDAGAAGNDLYIKFSDVQYDRKYRLHIAVHFIDQKTNAELGSIPLERYHNHFCTLSGCMSSELDQVTGKIGHQLVRGTATGMQ